VWTSAAGAVATTIGTILLSAGSAHGFAIGFFTIEVWLFVAFLEVAASLKGDGFLAAGLLLPFTCLMCWSRWSIRVCTAAAVGRSQLGALLSQDRLAR